MCGPPSGAQCGAIEKKAHTRKRETMTSIAEPFLSAEIEYRQQHIAEQFSHSRGRRHWVPRRPSLHLPPSGRKLVTLAFGD